MKRLSRRIKIASRPFPGEDQPSQRRDSSEEESILQYKPFYIKFSRLKTNLTPRHSSKEDCFSQPSKSDEMISKRVFTEAETNDLYASDFDSEAESRHISEAVQEQNQNLQQSRVFSPRQSCEDPQKVDPYQFYSLSYFRKRNQQLIDHIQYLRFSIPLFKRNLALLNGQKREIQELKIIKGRLLDYNYELKLDRQNKKKVNLSKCQKSQIKEHTGIFQKRKYQRVKQSDRKAHPDSFQMQYSSVDLEPQARRLSMEREDLLARKKQYYRREDKLKMQEQKIRQYIKILDMYQSILSRGNLQKLEDRKQCIEAEILSKKTIFRISEIELNLDITNVSNQIAIIETRLLHISNYQSQIKQSIKQRKQLRKMNGLESFTPNKGRRIRSKPSIMSTASPKARIKSSDGLEKGDFWIKKKPGALETFVLDFKERKSSIFLMNG